MLSRRAFVFGGVGVGAVVVAGGTAAALVEEDVLPGKVRFDRAIGRCRSLPPTPGTPGVVTEQTFRSRYRNTDVAAAVVLPAGVTSPRGLPVAVALHGNGGTGPSAARDLRLDRYLTDAVRRGVPPFALVAVDGGPNTYWHRRADGEDPLKMITEELLPRLGRQGARVDRFGIIGWSMGGYGALLLAETAGAPRTAAAVAASPAVFPSYDDARRTNHLAFDDAADFARGDVFAAEVMAGYWQRPEETANVMTADGFFRTGDIGVMDERGYTKIVDRKKDMILVSGFNVYPNEIEEVIASHPGVLECAVIGVQDAKSGEAVKAFIVKKDPNLTPEEVIKFCGTQLTAYKVPKQIVFRTDLPKTNVGKILRRELRDEKKAPA